MTTFTDLFAGGKGTAWYADIVTLATRLTTVTNAIEGQVATSTTSLSPAVGTMTFTTAETATERPFAAGATLRARSAADPAKYAVGRLVSFSGTTLQLDATLANGSGAVTDWVIAYEGAYSLVLSLDLAPKLSGDLDANGKSVSGLLNLTASGAATVGGAASVGGAATFSGRVRIARAGEHATAAASAAGGVVTLTADSAAIVTDTLTGDRTYEVAGAWTPGHDYSLEVRLTQDATGGRDVTILPWSRLVNSLAFGTTTLDGGWQRSNVTPTQDIATPAGAGWTLAAGGSGDQYVQARRPAGIGADFDGLAAVLLKAGASSRARVGWRLDTYAHGAYVDVDLSAGTIGAPVVTGSGTVLASGIFAVDPTIWPGWHVVWLAADMVRSDADGILAVYPRNAAGAVSYTAAGETILIGGACFGPGATYRGFQNVGATRAAMVSWRGSEVDFAAQAASEASRVLISAEYNGAIVLDDASV